LKIEILIILYSLKYIKNKCGRRNNMKKCIACGSDQLTDGDIVSTGMHLFVYGTPVGFNPKERKGNLTIFGTACLKCGNIQLSLDHIVLQKRINK
jgi:predicted nucleic-acid-binding Zn-ribbon protein